MNIKTERLIQEYEIQVAKEARSLCEQGEFEKAWQVEKKVIKNRVTKERYMEIAKKRKLDFEAQSLRNKTLNFEIAQYG